MNAHISIVGEKIRTNTLFFTNIYTLLQKNTRKL